MAPALAVLAVAPVAESAPVVCCDCQWKIVGEIG